MTEISVLITYAQMPLINTHVAVSSRVRGLMCQGSHRPGKVLEFDLGPGKLLEFEKVPFVLELSWNFVKSSLKI